MILTVGLPGSGKTTFANEYIESNPNTVNVNRDDLRKMLFNNYVPGSAAEQVVTQTQRAIIRDAFRRGKDVLISDTNLNNKVVAGLQKIALHFGAKVEVIHIKSDLQNCLVQDMNRQGEPPKVVGSEVINNFAKRYLNKDGIPTVLETDWSSAEFVPKPYEKQQGLDSAIIVDLDGTVALHQRSPYAYELIHTDLPNESVINIVEILYGMGVEIIFMSGRPDTYKPSSRAWIEKNIMVDEFQLHMRKAGDQRMDAIVKEELFLEHVDGKYNVLFCLDDRDQVVKLWRDKGLSCFQVNYGDF